MEDHSFSDEMYFRAFEEMRPKLISLLGDEHKAAEMDSHFAELLDREQGDQDLQAAFDQLMENMGQHAELWGEFQGILVNLGKGSVEVLMEPSAGLPLAVPPGTKMVCPVDASCPPKYVRVWGQVLYCDKHGVVMQTASDDQDE